MVSRSTFSIPTPPRVKLPVKPPMEVLPVSPTANLSTYWIRRDDPVHAMTDIFILFFILNAVIYTIWISKKVRDRLLSQLECANHRAFVLTTGGDGKTQRADRANVHLTLRVHHLLPEDLPQRVHDAREAVMLRLHDTRREMADAAHERDRNRQALQRRGPAFLRLLDSFDEYFAARPAPRNDGNPELMRTMTWEESGPQLSMAHYPDPEHAKRLQRHFITTINFTVEFPDPSFVRPFADSIHNTSTARITSIEWIFFGAPSHEGGTPRDEGRAPPEELRAPPGEDEAPNDG